MAAQKTCGDLSHPRRPLRVGSLIVLVSLLASLLLRPALAFGGKPKFGPNAVPILEQTAYLRTAAAPDYWRLNPFYVSQTTSSDCSVASITMAINFMLGLPAGAEEPIVTQSLLLKKIADARWAKEVANGGSGVSFAEFVSVVAERTSLQISLETIRPTDDARNARQPATSACDQRGQRSRHRPRVFQSGRTHGRLGRAAYFVDRRLRSGGWAGPDHGRGPRVVHSILDPRYQASSGDAASATGREWAACGTEGWLPLDQAGIIAMSKLTPAALMPRTHGRRADRAIRNGLALCCVAALRAHGPRSGDLASGEPMDEEEPLHEHVVERRQRDGQPCARPRDGGGEQTTSCANQAGNPLLDQCLASRG